MCLLYQNTTTCAFGTITNTPRTALPATALVNHEQRFLPVPALANHKRRFLPAPVPTPRITLPTRAPAPRTTLPAPAPRTLPAPTPTGSTSNDTSYTNTHRFWRWRKPLTIWHSTECVAQFITKDSTGASDSNVLSFFACESTMKRR